MVAEDRSSELLLERLEIVAEGLGRTTDDLIKEALERYLEDGEGDLQIERLRGVLARLRGRAHTDLEDVEAFLDAEMDVDPLEDTSSPEKPRSRRTSFLDEPPFDTAVFTKGDSVHRFTFAEFKALPLRQRVHLLLSHESRFYLNGREISRVQALRFHS